MRSLLGFLFIQCFTAIVSAQTITTCPANAKIYTTDDGSVYEHCPFADYQGTSTKSIPNIYTAVDCVQLCNKSSGCTQASWDAYTYSCNIKGSGTTWVQGAKTDTIRFISKGNQPVPGMTACPTTPTYYETPSGAVFEVCPNSDYAGNTVSLNWTIPDQQSCVNMCSATPGCVLGIWDKQYKACHVKSNSTTWVARSNQFDAIRLIAPPAAQPVPTGFTTCPNAVTQYTMDDGSVYAVCPGTDYSGYSYKVIPNVLSDWDCVRLCNGDSTCTLSVFDAIYYYCHFKATNVNWQSSNQFNTARLIQQGSRSGKPYGGLGRWNAPVQLPANPVGAFVVPGTTRILGFSSWGDDDYYGASGMTQFSDYDWTTGQVSARTVSNTQHDMFCPGISALGDGRVIVTGGEDSGKTSIYDPASNSFKSGANMNIARGYQSSVTLDSGEVFLIGGSFSGGVGGKTGELYDPAANTWTVLTGTNDSAAMTVYAGPGTEGNRDDHMWLYAWKQSSVFQAGPSRLQNWFGTAGAGNTTFSGTRDPNSDAMCGLSVMYDATKGKIWSGGGTLTYNNNPGLLQAHITTLGQPFQPATVTQVAALLRGRAFASVVVLPDGTILVTGGQSVAKQFQDDGSQFIADLYNPTTNSWTPLAASRVPRNYHSVALLLSDGRVMVGGGGLCWTNQGQSDANCDRRGDHPSIEIFSPPYLFNSDGTFATRPTISALSSTSNGSGSSAKAADTLTVTLGDNAAGYSFAMVRTGTATHTVNTDQRRVPLVASQNGSTWKMTLPADYGVLTPGYYYLFAINAKGVPSLAKTVLVAH